MNKVPETCVVRLNRPVLLAFFAVASLFILAGLDMAVFRRVLDFQVEPGKQWMFLLFVYGICFTLCGVIALQMLWYLVCPPVMLRMDENGLTFAVGMRYRPYSMAWENVSHFGYGAALNNASAPGQANAGATVTMKKSPEIPTMLVTSMGLQYAFGTLQVNALYANKSPARIVEQGKAFLAAFGTRENESRDSTTSA